MRRRDRTTRSCNTDPCGFQDGKAGGTAEGRASQQGPLGGDRHFATCRACCVWTGRRGPRRSSSRMAGRNRAHRRRSLAGTAVTGEDSPGCWSPQPRRTRFLHEGENRPHGGQKTQPHGLSDARGSAWSGPRARQVCLPGEGTWRQAHSGRYVHQQSRAEGSGGGGRTRPPGWKQRIRTEGRAPARHRGVLCGALPCPPRGPLPLPRPTPPVHAGRQVCCPEAMRPRGLAALGPHWDSGALSGAADILQGAHILSWVAGRGDSPALSNEHRQIVADGRNERKRVTIR